MRARIALVAALGAACGSGSRTTDASTPDAASPDGAADAPPAPPDAGPADALGAGAWCDPIHPLRRQLTARNNADTPLPAGFQVYWLIDIEDLATPPPPFDSLHVLHATATGCMEMARTIDDGQAAYEAIWVALADPIAAQADDAGYWLYYGNDAAPVPPSDPSLIFDFWEPFESGAAPDADWLTLGGPAVALGAALLGSEDHILSVDSWGAGTAVDYSLTIPSYVPDFWSGFQRDQSDFLDEPPWMLWYTEVNATGPVLWPSILLSTTDTMWWGTMVAIDADPHIYNIDRFADRVVFRYENYPASAEEHVLAAPFTDAMQFRFSNRGTATLTLHMVRVRQTAYPLPSSIVGAEETP